MKVVLSKLAVLVGCSITFIMFVNMGGKSEAGWKSLLVELYERKPYR